MFDNPSAPTALHEFFATHSDAIQNAALLLGGPNWLRRTRQILSRLSQPLPPTRLTLSEIRKLYNFLTLEYVHDRKPTLLSASPCWTPAVLKLSKFACSPKRSRKLPRLPAFF